MFRRLISLFLLLFAFIAEVSGQATHFITEWERIFREGGDNNPYILSATDDGGFIIGSLQTAVDDKLQPWERVSRNILIKTDNAGHMEWQKEIKSSKEFISSAITVSLDGGYVLAGNSIATGDNKINWIIIKLDRSGETLWEKMIETDPSAKLNSIRQTFKEGFIITGTVQGDSKNEITNSGEFDGRVIKLDKAGAVVWDKLIGGPGADFLTMGLPTADGGYIVGGSSDKGLSAAGGIRSGFDYRLVKLDAAGNTIWEKNYGGTDDEYLNVLEPTADKGYIIGGCSYSTGLTNTERPDFKGSYLILKLDPTGKPEWEASIGKNGMEQLANIIETSNGFLAAGNSLVHDANQDAQNTCYSKRPWVAALDKKGQTIFEEQLNTSMNMLNFVLDNDGAFVFAGVSSANIHDNDGACFTMSPEITMMRMSMNSSTGVEQHEQGLVKLYPNPANEQLVIVCGAQCILRRILIYDAEGKVVGDWTVNATGRYMVDLKALSVGSYFAVVETNEGSFKEAFLISR